MEEYRSNSHKSKEAKEPVVPEKKVGRVITGSARTKKKTGLKKIKESIVSDDADSVKSYILMDVLIPSIKEAISDIVRNGIDIILYGEPKHSGKNRSNISRVPYRSFWDDPNKRRERAVPRPRGSYDYDDIEFESRGDAEMVLDTLNEIISSYHLVSVGELYDAAGISTSNYTLYNYGWSDLSRAEIVRTYGGGYVIRMPKPMPID